MKVTITLDNVEMCIEGQHVKAVHATQEDPGNPEYFEPERIISLGALGRDDEGDRAVISLVEDWMLNARYDEIAAKCLEQING